MISGPMPATSPMVRSRRGRGFMARLARSGVNGFGAGGQGGLGARVDPPALVQQTLGGAPGGCGRSRGGTEAGWLVGLRRTLKHTAADFVRRYRGTGKRQVGREVPLGAPGDSSAAVG